MHGEVVEYLGRWSRLAVMVVIAAGAASATAQGKSPSAWTGQKDCFVRDINMPAQSLHVGMASACDAAADDTNATGDNAANAAYNAARAHNSLAEVSSPVSHYSSAIAAIAKSLQRVRNDHPSIVDSPKDKDKKVAAAKALANQRFRLGRTYEAARAYLGLGLTDPPVSAQATGGACSGRDSCLVEATRLLDSKDLARAFESEPVDTRYDMFVFLRGRAYAQLGRESDSGKARGDYEEIVLRGTKAGAPQGRAQLAATAKLELAKIYVRDGQAALQGQTTAASLGSAIDSFQKALGVDPAALDARMGLGRAYLAMADSTQAGQRENYAAAAETYGAAATMATQSGLVKEQAAAREGRGQALLAQSRIAASANSADAPGLLQQAIAEYKTSAGLEPNNAERQLTLARALDRAGQFDQADKAFEAAIKQLPTDTSLTSAALMEHAAVKGKLPKVNLQDVRYTLERAKLGNRQSARPDFEIGMTYYNQLMLDDAARSFQAAIAQAGGSQGVPAQGETEVKANAYYYLSLVSAQRAANGSAGALLAAVTNADAAVKVVGSSRTPYREHACVAHIIRGGTSVTAGDSSAACAGNDQPEGMLLLGMFNLRKAQFAAAAAQPGAREMAQFAFDQGLKEITRTGVAPELNQVKFKWPGSAPKPPPVKDLLEYGKAIVVACSSGLTVTLELTQQQKDDAKAFFGFYRVFECRAN